MAGEHILTRIADSMTMLQGQRVRVFPGRLVRVRIHQDISVTPGTRTLKDLACLLPSVGEWQWYLPVRLSRG
jgi:hypothetical protein